MGCREHKPGMQGAHLTVIKDLYVSTVVMVIIHGARTSQECQYLSLRKMALYLGEQIQGGGRPVEEPPPGKCEALALIPTWRKGNVYHLVRMSGDEK